MTLIANRILLCAGLSMFLFSCKGESKNIKDQAETIVENTNDRAEKVIADATKKMEEMKDEVVESTKDLGSGMDVNKEETTIVAPKANESENAPKPKPQSSTANTTKPSAGTNEVPKETTKPVDPVVSNESTKPEETNNSQTANNKGTVLKEIDKTVKEGKEKVKVDKIVKPGASASNTTTTKINNNQQDFGHSGFNSLLNKVVSSSGVVDYALLKANATELNTYCQLLEANAPQGSWSRNESLAYWLNAYNAYTLKLIMENYPLGSITDLNGGKPWDRKWINLDGKTLSLNDIENVIIRPTYGDARIHFAVNCAAKSCPPLANYAFTARNVNSKMEALTKAFINSSSNKITADKITISKIFDWYGSDFGDLIPYINKYSDVQVNANAKVEYMDYDWSLNGK